MAKETTNTYTDVISSVNAAYKTLVQGQLADAKTVASIVTARRNLRALKGLMRSTVSVITETTNTPDITARVDAFNKVFKKINLPQLTKTLQQFAEMKVSNRKVNQSLKMIDTVLERIKTIGEKYSKDSKFTDLKTTLVSIDELCKTVNSTAKNILGTSKDLKSLIRELTVVGVAATLMRPVMLAGIRSIQLVIKTLTDVFKKINTRTLAKKASDLKRTLGVITGAILTFSLGLFAVSALLITQSKTMLAGLAAFTLVVGAAVGLMYLINKKTVKKSAMNGAKVLMFISASFIGFALATLVLGTVTGPSLKALLGFTLVVGVAVGVLFLISLVRRTCRQSAVTLLLISASFVSFALTTILLGQITNNIDMKALEMFIGVIGVAVGLLALLSVMKSTILKGALALVLVSGVLILFTIPVMTISKITPNWGAFGFLAAVMGTGIAICAAAGIPVVIPLVLAGAGVLAAVGSAMLLFAITMGKIVEVGAQLDKTKLDAFLNNIKPVITAFKDGVKGLKLSDILKIRLLYGSVAKSLKTIAQAYDIIGKLDVDYDAMAGSVNRLVTSAINAFFDVSKDPEVAKMLTGKKKDTTVWKVISMSKSMGNTISSLASGVRDMAQMTVTEYDSEGRVKGKRRLTNADFALAGDGVARIITAFFTALQNTDNAVLKELLGGRLKKTTAWKAIEVAKEMGGAISELAVGVKDMATMTFKDANGKDVRVDIGRATENVVSLITGTVSGLSNIKFEKDTAKNLSETGKSLKTFTEATNGLDLQKSKAMSELMDKILQFSKGVNFNFEQLADIINGKLVGVLTDLRDTLKEMNGMTVNTNVNTTRTEKVTTFTGAPVGDSVSMSKTGSTPAPVTRGLKPEDMDKITKSLRSIEDALQDITTVGVGVKVKNFDDMPS